jgi:hypothetical protein
MDSRFGIDVQIRANKAAIELHEKMLAFPDWAQWSIPCDPTEPTDLLTALACQILQQNHPNLYVVLWSKKSLTIYRKEEWERIASKDMRDSLAKWNLTLRPQRTEEGLPVPFEAAGGLPFVGLDGGGIPSVDPAVDPVAVPAPGPNLSLVPEPAPELESNVVPIETTKTPKE